MNTAAYMRTPLAQARPTANANDCRCSMLASAAVSRREFYARLSESCVGHPSASLCRFAGAPSHARYAYGRMPPFTRSEKPMRWILLLLAFGAFALAFSTKSAGVMGLGLVGGIALLIAALFAFAAAKIEGTARPDAVLLTDKDINALRASVRKAKPPQPSTSLDGE